MKRMSFVAAAAVAVLMLSSVTSSQAVTMTWVTVGDPGNADDIHDVGFGGVDYVYNISKHEVTHGQYAEFLDAHATVGDPLALYNVNMTTQSWGGIVRTGSGTVGDPWDYEVKPDAIGKGPGGADYPYANKPVAYVSWYDAVRFSNWLHNGQGSGDTESGAYTLLGGTLIPSNGNSITRNPGAEVFLPSEDEWYKAAYYDPNKAGGAGYYQNANGSDAFPDNNLPSLDSGNSANWGGAGSPDSWPYPLTDVGSYPLSESPYGTSDQAGSVYEWNEALVGGTTRRNRGGAWTDNTDIHMEASDDTHYSAGEFEHVRIGFRVGSVVPDCILGDGDCDGYVDIANDIIPAFSNFTGPGTFTKTRAEGDVHGDGPGATTNPAGHDGDVDVQDLLTMFGNFTGPAPDGSGGLVAAEAGDANIPDLIYNAATGEVTLDVDGSGIIGYVLKNGSNSFAFGNHLQILAGVKTSVAGELSEAAFASSVGANSIGNVFPTGMNLAALTAYLIVNDVSRSLGAPVVPFDLVVLSTGPAVPEPATVVLSVFGLIGLGFVTYRKGAYRRRRVA